MTGILAAVAIVVVLVGLGIYLTTPPEEPSDEQPSAAGEQEPATAPPRTLSYDAPPPMTIDATRNYTATITTPRGDIVVKLLPEIAPQTVNSFVFLAREGFYDGLTWHRVLEGFMAQGGDPTGTGMGGPGYNVPAEFTSEILFDRPGIVAMARATDPDSAGSQFFITTAPAPFLNEQYTIFGEVVEGQEIANNIPLRDPQNPADSGTPGEEIVSITIEEGA
jgi:peptidylprolyl isomerase